MPVYSGNVFGFAEWAFKVRNRARVPAATVEPEAKAIKLRKAEGVQRPKAERKEVEEDLLELE